jgi:ankyrin repeat protein
MAASDAGKDVGARALEAVEGRNVDALRELLDVNKAAVLAFRERDGKTLVHNAAIYNAIKCLEILVAAGADKDLPNSAGQSPLHWAAWQRKHESVQWLLSAGAKPTPTDNWGLTPLHKAAEENSVPCVEALLRGGADPVARTVKDWIGSRRFPAGSTPADMSKSNEVKALLAAAARGAARSAPPPPPPRSPPTQQQAGEQSIEARILSAASSGNAAALRALLAQNKEAVLRVREQDGKTVLHTAAIYNQTECVRILMEAGCDKDSRD